VLITIRLQNFDLAAKRVPKAERGHEAATLLCGCGLRLGQRSRNALESWVQLKGFLEPRDGILRLTLLQEYASHVAVRRGVERSEIQSRFQFRKCILKPSKNRDLVERARGSGVIVTPDGYVLTNHHVVDGADEISVELTNRRSFSDKVVGSDAPSDLALVKVDATGLPVLPLGDSDTVRVGDICLAVGNPLGIGETVTAGIISAKGRATGLSDGSFEDFLQTDAAINQGNSGGALVNAHGELIGINSQIVSPSGGNIGIGFAIPSNMARNVTDQLKTGGKVRRGRLGVGIQEITSDLAKSLGLTEVRGVLVNSVYRDGPAEHAGLRPGDHYGCQWRKG
jgi:S1-C subfamily serine protease